MSLHNLAHKIRHHKFLEKMDIVWNILRIPYRFIIDPFNKGVPLKINDDVTIRLPVRYYSKNISLYEKEPTEYLTSWIKSNPKSIVIDIGSALGFISSIALHASDEVRLIAIDSDIMSLKIGEYVCSYAIGERIERIHCYISDIANEKVGLTQSKLLTNLKLKNIKLSEAIQSNRYQIFNSSVQSSIPVYSIDSLFEDEVFDMPILIKCDIEGAEVLAIRGANKFIAKYKPVLAISVHPGLIENYDSNSTDFRNMIISQGYTVELISIDHEEHWWCVPI